ncbi:AT-hook-containing transcription factor [Austrofundulus limnaeus]|uniref:AT-hook-containing transcription factor n=1 Tax=Austrofundulus limnaeus TaxID=52670 RepID=A0A2I4CJV8_AUSLI|nr:PREDICTED: AT-hook-containing transcription factor-like [Austrofundulus limnaeus]
METRRKTTPGILTWTPAPPALNSSSSSSEDKDDFFSQMDENGVIGLSDLEEAESGHPPEGPEPLGPGAFRPGHFTPDFSKVEPRVYFPKGGYKPPRSQQSLVSPEAHIAFKSPADIVMEVLFDSDGSSTPTNAATFIVPPEFRCRQQASTLLQQLQDDYNRLLTKYAEAENTIDRLRLEAKVNLNFDPAQAGPSVLHPGLSLKKFLNLDFCAAQRAETPVGPPGPNGSPRCKDSDSPHAVLEYPALGQQLSSFLISQTERFLQQLETFEDLIKNENLTHCQKKEGVSRLSEGLNSLERSYLLTRDEHRLLQQRGLEACPFDPERELEGLIFQCGLHVEELKEQQTPGSSSTSEEEQTLTPPQSLHRSPEGPADPGPSSASNKSDDEEEKDEETVRPLISEHTCVESRKTQNLGQTLKNPDRLRVSSPDVKTSEQPESEEEEQTSRRTRTDLKTRVESDQDSPICSRNQQTCSQVDTSFRVDLSSRVSPSFRVDTSSLVDSSSMVSPYSRVDSSSRVSPSPMISPSSQVSPSPMISPSSQVSPSPMITSAPPIDAHIQAAESGGRRVKLGLLPIPPTPPLPSS